MTREYRHLINFYKQVALMIIKADNKRVTLRELEKRFHNWRYEIYGWMQWSDAKVWFGRAITDSGTTYTLHPEYADLTVVGMIAKMNEYYGLYQD